MVSLVINLVYVGLLKTIDDASDQQVQRQVQKKRAFSWSKLMYLPHSYWLIASMEFLLGGAWGCFLHIDRYLNPNLLHNINMTI